MSATVANRTNRFFRPGTTRIVIMPTVVASTLIPTRSEINAGKDVSLNVADVGGFTVTGAKIDTADWGSRVVTNVAGRISLDDSSLTFWADSAGADARADFALDQVVYVAFMDAGDVPTKKMDVYKTQVLSVSSTKSGDAAAQVVVNLALKDYADQVTIPAAA